MSVNGVYRVQVISRNQRQNIVNSLAYKCIQQATAERDICQALADLFNGANVSPMRQHLPAETTIEEIVARRIQADPSPPGRAVVGEVGDLLSGTLMPPHIARVITFYSDSNNSRRRGRFFLAPCLTEHMGVDTGFWSPSAVGALNNLGAQLMSNLSGNGDEFQLVLPPTLTLPVANVIAAKAQQRPGTVRNRRIKNGLIG